MNISEIELQAQQRLAETGLSAAELLSMDMGEYARVTGRPTVGQLAAQVYDAEPPGTPRLDAPEAPHNVAQPPASASPGIDLSSMDMATYGALRGQLGMGQSRAEGRGIFDSVSSRSDEYRNAVRAQSGRTGWSTSNVVESPRVGRVFLKPEVPPDNRPAQERFSRPGNFFGA